jgi:hypothetical protein
MVDAISSATRTDPNQDLDPDRTTQPATRVVVPPPPPPDLPDVTAFIQNAVKAATGQLAAPAPAPHPMLAMGVRGADLECITHEQAIQERLDAFMESATPVFHTPETPVVKVAIPFRMALPTEFMQSRRPEDQPYIAQERVARAHAGELGAVARGQGLDEAQVAELSAGRGTPETIRRVTQALIDAGKLPPGPADTWDRIRTMMCNYGVGLDCAGFVQQAFLATRSVSRADSGLKPILDEDLKGLAARGFKSVPLSEARAGDLFILDPPKGENTGHTIIIRGVRMAQPEEARALAEQAAAAHQKGWGRPDASTVQRFDFCSSWGNDNDATAGGVQQQVFWHDTVSGKWMHPSRDGWKVEDTPYFSHPLAGVYRPSKDN